VGQPAGRWGVGWIVDGEADSHRAVANTGINRVLQNLPDQGIVSGVLALAGLLGLEQDGFIGLASDCRTAKLFKNPLAHDVTSPLLPSVPVVRPHAIRLICTPVAECRGSLVRPA
jgi:hypothetical protein